ncbi:DUF3263 domain-containing protein [Streptomyces tsukubensis]|nr:DUF3263 domain-containing protein [Streptomyces tsukubensis]
MGDAPVDEVTPGGDVAEEARPAHDAAAGGAGPAGNGPTGDGIAGAGPAGDKAGARPLSDRDLAVLALERAGAADPGVKERAIRERLGMSPTRYYQLLNALLDDDRAERHDPVTVHRLRRVRQARRAAR